MPDASVIIATRNRRREVGRAIASALAQTADVEVLVTDDASDDGTAEEISADFPSVRLWRSERARGSLVHRNAMAEVARSPILISLDDDAELCSPRTVAQVLERFDDPQVAAVGIPFFDAPRPTGCFIERRRSRGSFSPTTTWAAAQRYGASRSSPSAATTSRSCIPGRSRTSAPAGSRAAGSWR